MYLQGEGRACLGSPPSCDCASPDQAPRLPSPFYILSACQNPMTRISYFKGNLTLEPSIKTVLSSFQNVMCVLRVHFHECIVPHPSPGLSLPHYSCASSFWPALPPSGPRYCHRANCSRCPCVTYLRAKCSRCSGVTMFSNRYVHLLTENLSSAQDIVDPYLVEICEHP